VLQLHGGRLLDLRFARIFLEQDGLRARRAHASDRLWYCRLAFSELMLLHGV
jgi:hypothetical protein